MNLRTYYLKNKDKIILQFEICSIEIDDYLKENQYKQEVKNIQVFSDLLPINLNKNDLQNSLKKWIEYRKIPNNRKFSENIIATYSDDKQNLIDYIDVSLCLSLNDTFWVVPTDKNYSWKQYNLYDNDFNKELELVAFSGKDFKVNGITLSPEYTTNGMLKKCWYRENNKIYLYKGSTKQYANGGKEAFSEYYLTQIAKILNIDYVDYDLKLFNNEIVSSCEIFTNQTYGYIPIHYFLTAEELKKDKKDLLNAIAKIYGKEKLKDMLLFDALIYNSDRHLGNFGMLINNDTLEIIKPAPIFDNGCSMLNYLIESELDNIENILDYKYSFFGYQFNSLFFLNMDKKYLKNFKKLSEFEFIRHPKFNLDEKWLVAVEKYIQKKAKLAINYLE